MYSSPPFGMWLTSNPGDIASRKRVGGIENQGRNKHPAINADHCRRVCSIFSASDTNRRRRVCYILPSISSRRVCQNGVSPFLGNCSRDTWSRISAEHISVRCDLFGVNIMHAWQYINNNECCEGRLGISAFPLALCEVCLNAL